MKIDVEKSRNEQEKSFFFKIKVLFNYPKIIRVYSNMMGWEDSNWEEAHVIPKSNLVKNLLRKCDPKS